MKISFDSNSGLKIQESLFDLIPNAELNLDTLKDAKDAKPSQEEIDEELSERAQELNDIELFLKKKKENPPVVEEKVAEEPLKKTKRGFSSGRPRKSFAKEISFIQLDDGKYKLSGRGRPNPNQKRTKVTVHFSWLDSLTPQRFYTKKDISKMTKVMP
jgi:hypothetical protein|tara:strand:- start:600 stop:1073 length:474 start_codon:yes stop_codon:yes gene_type:complete